MITRENAKMTIEPHKFKGVYFMRKGKWVNFLTKNLTPGKTVYGEHTHTEGKNEFREWEPKRSKLGAALVKGISQLGIYPGMKVLYLGASTGTTSSHVSDIVGEDGVVFALDFAPRTTRELMYVCEQRKNMMPILADAKRPETYAHQVCIVDAVFQDIAQRGQAEIFIRNCDAFLKNGGFGILTIKARSIDVAKKPKQVFNEVRTYLEKKITVVDYRELDPFEKDHCIFLCKKK
jgi:fibrillarin-like pre-rRNA processing protein